MANEWPDPSYEVRAEFDAPLEFVFRWCTDYTSRDARYEGEKYKRLIVRRSSRRVIYEDLDEGKDGWHWARHVVTLHPPDRWHSDSVGSHRDIDLDYRLSRLPGDRTRLVLTARRRPTALGTPNPSRASWERSVGLAWARFGNALRRDFRRSRANRTRHRAG